MKLHYSIYCLLALCLSGASVFVQAQPQIGLRMAFHAEQNRYEVFARPNFSARNFTWGPSQVSIVLPANQAKGPLSVKSTVVGTWIDNSVVTKPQVAPDLEFHGVTTSGGKLDLVAGEEFVLFDFVLPTGFVEHVRLFNNTTDPNSSQAGMKGGDFRSYMADEKGADYLAVESAPVSLSVIRDESAVNRIGGNEPSMQVVAYPNPATSGTFRLFLKGFEPDETLNVRFHTLTGVEEKRFSDKVSNLAGRAITLPNAEGAYWILNVERPTTHQIFTQKIWQRD